MVVLIKLVCWLKIKAVKSSISKINNQLYFPGDLVVGASVCQCVRQFRSLVQKDSTCHRTTELVRVLQIFSRAQETQLLKPIHSRASVSQLLKARCPRALSLQEEKPL